MVMFEKQNEGRTKIRVSVPNYVAVLAAIAVILIALVLLVMKLCPDVLFWLW